MSEYEQQRNRTMKANNAYLALLDKVKIGKVVHVPHSVFPQWPAPPEGYWVGKTVSTSLGGSGDIGIQIPGDDLFTRPRSEVADWLVEDGKYLGFRGSDKYLAAATGPGGC